MDKDIHPSIRHWRGLPSTPRFRCGSTPGEILTIVVKASVAERIEAEDQQYTVAITWRGAGDEVVEPSDCSLAWSQTLNSFYFYLPREAGDFPGGTAEHEITVPDGCYGLDLVVFSKGAQSAATFALTVLAGSETLPLEYALKRTDLLFEAAATYDLRRKTINDITSDYMSKANRAADYILPVGVVTPKPVRDAVLLQLEFLNVDGEIIAGPVSGFSFSERYGPYMYLHGEPGFSIRELPVPQPSACQAIRFRFHPWKDKGATLFSSFKLLEKGGGAEKSSTGGGMPAYPPQHLLHTFEGVIVIYAGTKSIGLGNRANRPMMFAREAAKHGWLALYVYWRDDPKDRIPEPQEGLIQVPNDIFVHSFNEIAKLDHPRKLLLTSMPDVGAVQMQDIFRHSGWKIIYEVRDEWEEFANVGQAKWWSHWFERRVAITSNAVTTVSRPLATKMVSMGCAAESVAVVPNGTTEEFISFYKSNATSRGAHSPMKVGYFGHLTASWFDWTSLCAAARAMPEVRFEIIGFDPPENQFVPTNVVYLGSKTHDEIRDIASQWNIGLIPFKRTKLTRAVDPIKVYEYIALRLMVVTAPMGSVDEMPNVFVYNEPESLADALGRALSTSFQDGPAVAELVDSSSWGQRFRTTVELADKQ